MPATIERPKFFTLEEANARIPLLRSILRDVTELSHELKGMHERLILLQTNGAAGPAHERDIAQLAADMDRRQQLMRDYVRELAELGAILKDDFMGLVDFPAMLDGREVCLCYKLGESAIAHWHEVDAGYNGRRPLSRATRFPMTDVAFYLLVFLVVGSFFLFIHLVMGKFIRPSNPGREKLTIYECGEPTVGSAWIQFDLRYYVVALLFVVFDVEVAFFFPWAVVFGTANEYARVDKDSAEAQTLVTSLQPPGIPAVDNRSAELTQAGAKGWAWLAFSDIIVFFGVLMVGFAYLWRRGDIDWIRAVPEAPPGKLAELPVKV